MIRQYQNAAHKLIDVVTAHPIRKPIGAKHQGGQGVVFKSRGVGVVRQADVISLVLEPATDVSSAKLLLSKRDVKRRATATS